MSSENEELVRRARSCLQQHITLGGVPVVHHDHGCYPHYANRADGCRFWDVDGCEYIDWFGGGGPCMLGHRHPEVQRAVLEQLDRGAHLSIPGPLEVEVAERLCAMIPGAEQVQFSKNGTDATSAAVRLARAATGRDRLLVNGYHGFQDWSMAVGPEPIGIPASVAALTHRYPFNDLGRADALMRQYGDDVAAIVVAPLQEEAPVAGFLAGLRALCDRHGALLVFDEVVSGFRVARGGMQEREGVHADLVCLGKALGNGFPIAATVGPRRFMKHFGSFRYGMTARREALSYAAANACLKVYESQDVPAHLARIGRRLQAGFDAAARERGLDWTMTGLPHWPHLRLSGSERVTSAGVHALFLEAVQRRGIFVSSPRIWPCLMHGETEVDRTLEVMIEAMETTREAMRDGLGRHVDRPVYSGLDRGLQSGVPAQDWRDEQIPVPFSCAVLRRGGVVLSGSTPGARTVAEAGDGELLFDVSSPAGKTHGDEVTAVAATFTQPIAGDCSILADYGFLDWRPRNATVDVVLAANDVDGKGHNSVSHTRSLAGTSCLQTTGSSGCQRAPCVADIQEGTLVLQRRGGAWNAQLRCAGDEIALPVVASPREVPVRVTFRLRATGNIDHVRLVLRNLRVASSRGEGAE